MVIAFRKIGRQNNIHFANTVFEDIRSRSECFVLATDISDYFGSIKHPVLKAAWCGVLGVSRLPEDHFKVFRAVTEYAWVDREQLCQALGIHPDSPRADGRNRYCTPLSFASLSGVVG